MDIHTYKIVGVSSRHSLQDNAITMPVHPHQAHDMPAQNSLTNAMVLLLHAPAAACFHPGA